MNVPSGQDPLPLLRLCAQRGEKGVRLDMAWAGIERSKGRYTWSTFDKIQALCESSGMRPLYVLGDAAPLWWGGTGDQHAKTLPSTPEQIAAYAKFAAAAVARYDADYELYNEPDKIPGVTMAQYVSVVSPALEACRKVRPDARLYVGALAHAGDIEGARLEEFVVNARALRPLLDRAHLSVHGYADPSRLRGAQELVTQNVFAAIGDQPYALTETGTRDDECRGRPVWDGLESSWTADVSSISLWAQEGPVSRAMVAGGARLTPPSKGWAYAYTKAPLTAGVYAVEIDAKAEQGRAVVKYGLVTDGADDTLIDVLDDRRRRLSVLVRSNGKQAFSLRFRDPLWLYGARIAKVEMTDDEFVRAGMRAREEDWANLDETKAERIDRYALTDTPGWSMGPLRADRSLKVSLL